MGDGGSLLKHGNLVEFVALCVDTEICSVTEWIEGANLYGYLRNSVPPRSARHRRLRRRRRQQQGAGAGAGAKADSLPPVRACVRAWPVLLCCGMRRGTWWGRSGR
jgi:hypothetical protein